MKILLLCAAGMSTSLVVSKMIKSLDETQKDWVIEAHPIENLVYLIEDFDVVLLGPQVGHKLKNTQKAFGDYNKPIDVIPSVDYAMGNGDKILKKAITMYEGK